MHHWVLFLLTFNLMLQPAYGIGSNITSVIIGYYHSLSISSRTHYHIPWIYIRIWKKIYSANFIYKGRCIIEEMKTSVAHITSWRPKVNNHQISIWQLWLTLLTSLQTNSIRIRSFIQILENLVLHTIYAEYCTFRHFSNRKGPGTNERKHYSRIKQVTIWKKTSLEI